MARYRAFRRAPESNGDDVGYTQAETITVHESDEWIDTGLYDADGVRLFRTKRVACGFLRRD